MWKKRASGTARRPKSRAKRPRRRRSPTSSSGSATPGRSSCWPCRGCWSACRSFSPSGARSERRTRVRVLGTAFAMKVLLEWLKDYVAGGLPGGAAAEPASGAAAVEIAAPDLCHRYVALVLRNVKVQPAPDWLRKRLEACGIASINNIVDVTNYVLLELGHPPPAFDLDTLSDKKIIVRTAQPGEKLTTLDGVARALKSHHLVIADAKRPLALAGLMGGADTEISLRTKNVLLESAWFDPIATRRAAKELGLRTEASYRFERGMDVEAPLGAARRCAELFLELAGGGPPPRAPGAYPRRSGPPEIPLRP